ncbi:MAG TPA: helix-turn-helix domain-containing protein, partial [Candidatus Tumulicola sp.]|nr:helix-turn-helix domain-containing protein [Candidatus Tumulicola sp.]
MLVAMPIEPGLDRTQLRELAQLAYSDAAGARVARRARTILLAAEGVSDVRIARELGVGRAQVARWRNRFVEGGWSAVACDRPRSDRPATIDVERILASIRGEDGLGPAPTVGGIAKLCGVSEASVARVRRRYGLARPRPRAPSATEACATGVGPAPLGVFLAARCRVLAFDAQGVTSGAKGERPAGSDAAHLRARRPTRVDDGDGEVLAYLSFLDRVAAACSRERGAALVCESDAVLSLSSLDVWRGRNPYVAFEIADSSLDWRRRIDRLLALRRRASPMDGREAALHAADDAAGDLDVPEIVSALLDYFTVARCHPTPFVWV